MSACGSSADEHELDAPYDWGTSRDRRRSAGCNEVEKVPLLAEVHRMQVRETLTRGHRRPIRCAEVSEECWAGGRLDCLRLTDRRGPRFTGTPLAGFTKSGRSFLALAPLEAKDPAATEDP